MVALAGVKFSTKMSQPMRLALILILMIATVFSGPVVAITEEEKQARLQIKREAFGGLSFLFADQIEAGEVEPLLNFTVNDSLFVNWLIPDNKVTDLEAVLDLPQGLALAPIRILKGEKPRHYLSLNVYQVTIGEPTVRAEWSVYVASEDDPRPRFLVIEAHSSTDWFDPVSGLVPASMVQYSRDNGVVSATIDEEGAHLSVQFSESDRRANDRFGSMSWARANDKIYWRNGVIDKVFYNGSLTDTPVVSVFPTKVSVVNETAWEPFVQDVPRHVLLYNQPLEFAISPWNNLQDPDLGLAPEFLQQLRTVKAQQFSALARFNALQIFLGQQEALFDFTVSVQKPSYFMNFRVRPDKLDELTDFLNLPPEFQLSKINALRYQNPEFMISLNVYEGSGIVSGARAEWSVYVRHTDEPDRPYFMVVDAATSEPSLDPVNLFTPAAELFNYEVDNTGYATTLIRNGVSQFSASFSLPDSRQLVVRPSSDWVLANDKIFWVNGIYDRLLYNGKFIDAKMRRVDLSSVSIDDDTPWRDFVDPVPLEVLVFQNTLEYKILPWYNLEELPVDQ